MEYRYLGASGFKVPVLSLGTGSGPLVPKPLKNSLVPPKVPRSSRGRHCTPAAAVITATPLPRAALGAGVGAGLLALGAAALAARSEAE